MNIPYEEEHAQLTPTQQHRHELTSSVSKLFDLAKEMNDKLNTMHTDYALLTSQVTRVANVIEGTSTSRPISEQFAVLRNEFDRNSKRIDSMEDTGKRQIWWLIGALTTSMICIAGNVLQFILHKGQ